MGEYLLITKIFFHYVTDKTTSANGSTRQYSSVMEHVLHMYKESPRPDH